MNLKIINKSGFELPEYKTEGSAGMDLQSTIDFELKPLERKLIPTDLYIEIPKGFEGNVRPRSGLSLKVGLFVIEGTVDSDYRGNVGVIVCNLSDKEISIHKGERIAQIVFNQVEQARLIEVTELLETERGENGFGSTGIK